MAEVAEQAGKILGALSGTATVWGLDLGLRLGVFDHLAERPAGATADEVAAALKLDAQYTHVVLRAAYAAEVLDLDEGRYRLAEHMDVVLLDADSPAYLAGALKTFVALRETYLDLRDFARDGRREWWSDFDPEWIDAVGDNGQVFYRRLLNLVIPKLPAVSEALVRGGARYLDLASGVCRGPAKIVDAYPSTSVTAVDGDAFTLEQAELEMKERGIGEQFTYVHSMLEDLDLDGGHDFAIINISLHEARDIARVVERAHAALDPGGTFIVSEFPFPEREEDVRSVPGRLMSGIQFFEAHIGCQLLPAARFVEHLETAGFKDVGVIEVTPMHVVIHGTK
jgi:ubiquinone/menaquinone biosynthesis C-methylase UbiE